MKKTNKITLFFSALSKFLPIVILSLVSLAFSWKYLLKGLAPIPSDVIVGIYYPWRDYVWNNFITGVPYKNGLLSDVVSIIYPWRIYGMELIKQGVPPLWIPFTLGGSPLLANFQSGLLYPLNILFMILPNIHAWSIYIIIQPVLFSVFLYLYLRSINFSKTSSIFSGIVFAFCGFNQVWFEYGILGHAGVWLPLFLLCVEKMRSEKKLFWLISCSFFIAFSFLAGYPQITLYSLVFFILYILFRFISTKKFVYLLPFFSIIVGVFLSAVQLIPGVELLTQSIRQTDPTTASFSYGIVPIKQFVVFIFPDFFGNPATGNSWGWAGYNESAVYVGIVGIIFAISTFFVKKRDFSFFFKWLLLILIIITFQSPIANFVQKINLPGLAMASRSRFLFLIDFCLAILAGYGLDNFILKRERRTIILADISICFSIMFIWACVLFCKKFIVFTPELMSNLTISGRNMIFPSAIFLIFQPIFIIFPRLHSKIHEKLSIVLILFVIIIDLFRFGFKYNPFSYKEFLYPRTGITDYLNNKNEVYRTTGLFPQSMWIPFGLYSLEGYDPLMINSYAELLSKGSIINNKTGISSRWAKTDDLDPQILDLLGVKYFLNYRGDATTNWDPEYYRYSEDKFKLIFQYGKSQIYERINVFPRAYLVHNFIVENDKTKTIEILKDKTNDLKNTVVLEEKPTLKLDASINSELALIDWTMYNKNNFLVKTSSGKNGILFLSDVLYQGWKVYVDGSPQKILRANGVFRAVEVPMGVHEIRFTYEPLSFKLGLYVSLFSVVVLSVIMFLQLLFFFRKLPLLNK